MSQDNAPQPTRKLVTSTATAPGLPTATGALTSGLPTATGALTSGPATMSAATISAVPVPPAKAKGSMASTVILSLGLVGAAVFAYLEWDNGKKLTTEVSELNQKVSGLQSELTALQAENAKNLANYEETKSNLEASESKGRELQTELDEKRKSLTETVAERDELRTSLAAKSEELTKKETELTQLKSDLDDTQTKARGLEQSGSLMEAELKQLREEYNNLRAEKFKNSANIPGGTLDQVSAAPKTEQAAVKTTRPRGVAWIKLGKYKSGENAGKWYYVGPDEYTSKLYATRNEAIEAAENRLGYTQSKSR